MVAEIWSSVISPFVDQWVALNLFYDDRSSLWVFIFLGFNDAIIFVCISHSPVIIVKLRLNI